MVSRFEPNPDLDAVVAAKFARPMVERATDTVRDAARAGAPPVKIWVTMQDERVRHSHAKTDGQAVPDNLRFKVPKVRGSGADLARHPRDEALPLDQKIRCRCEDVTVQDMLSRTIQALPVVLQGTRVVGTVETRFKRAAESENGTTGDTAAHFMLNALRQVAAAMRTVRARR